MVTFSARVERIDIDRPQFVAQVSEIERKFHSSLTRRIANSARIKVPVRTGNLGRSIREDEAVFTGLFRISGGVTAHADYAAAVHEGTRPHVIRARRAAVLSFEWHGRRVFFRSVHHPGTRARPFLANAAREVVASDDRITRL